MAPETLLWLCISILTSLIFLLTLAVHLQTRSLKMPRPQHKDDGKQKSRHSDAQVSVKVLDQYPSHQEGKKKKNKRLHDKGRHANEVNFTRLSPVQCLHNPCSHCREVNAKKDCRYMRCATCCRGNIDSVCHAHGTGYSVAERAVESAVLYRMYQCDISYSNLSRYPPKLTSIGRQLFTLNLSNNRLKSLPEDISQLSGLQELFLQYNHLSRLPVGISSLTSLVELDAKNNQLTYLPESLCNLRKLIVLNLTNNSLRHLPARIGNLANLEELSIHCNLIDRLPSSFCQLTNLQMFYAGENKLSHLPEQFGRLTKLEELDLSNCNLVMLPESFSCCKSLCHVWLNGNKLATLPFKIGDLQNLSELHIRNNSVKFLPASVVHLNLYTFTAQNNCFLDEATAKASSSLSCGPPPLLELTARTVYRLKIFPSPDSIPSHLSRILRYPLFCASCGGPIFSYQHLANFSFVTMSVYYRVPIYQMYCSPNCLPKSLRN